MNQPTPSHFIELMSFYSTALKPYKTSMAAHLVCRYMSISMTSSSIESNKRATSTTKSCKYQKLVVIHYSIQSIDGAVFLIQILHLRKVKGVCLICLKRFVRQSEKRLKSYKLSFQTHQSSCRSSFKEFLLNP